MSGNSESLIHIALVGAGGRMGRLLAEVMSKDSRFELVGLLETAGYAGLNQAALKSHPTVLYTSDTHTALSSSNVIIDFSLPQGTLAALRFAIDNQKCFVTGTTGFSDEEMEFIRKASEVIPIVQASNMSIGITILSELLNHLRQFLPHNFDVEIVERHHRYKKDSPSGTALHLAEIFATDESKEHLSNIKIGRNKGIEPRDSAELFVHSVRGGGIVGEHTVYCIGESEEISISHRAFDRKIFVAGALQAALFIVDASPGLYSMNDVLEYKQSKLPEK